MLPEIMSSSDETQAVDPEVTNENGSYVDKRKSSKPVMEKRRRARINNSLNQLKSILLEALKKDSTRHSKLEKADILEMTVNYLKNVERQRLSMSLSIDPSVLDKYKAGFNECRNEVMRFLSTCEGVTVDTRTNLLSHLASCIRCIQSLQTQTNVFDDNGFNSLPLQTSLLINGSVYDGLASSSLSTMPNSILASGCLSTSIVDSDPNNIVESPTRKQLELSDTIQATRTNLMRRNDGDTINYNVAPTSGSSASFMTPVTSIPPTPNQSYQYELHQINHFQLSPSDSRASPQKRNISPVFQSPRKSPEMGSSQKISTIATDCLQQPIHYSPPVSSGVHKSKTYQRDDNNIGNTERQKMSSASKDRRPKCDREERDLYLHKSDAKDPKQFNNNPSYKEYDNTQQHHQRNSDKRHLKRMNGFCGEVFAEESKRKRLSKTKSFNDSLQATRNSRIEPFHSINYSETIQNFYHPITETQTRARANSDSQSFPEDNGVLLQAEPSSPSHRTIQVLSCDVNNNKSRSLSHSKPSDKNFSTKKSNPWRPWSDNTSAEKIS